MGVYTLPKGINLKVNVITQMLQSSTLSTTQQGLHLEYRNKSKQNLLSK